MHNLMVVYLYFWIISIIGWFMEIFVCSISERKIVNRGFLLGPYCPIYGFGALIMLLLDYFKGNVISVFVLAMILCSLLEYLVSYLMELIFKVRFWDYSEDIFNLNGRICLRNALAFGLLGTILVLFLKPFIFSIFESFTTKKIAIWCISIFVLTMLDIIISMNLMYKIRGKIKVIRRDATNDIKTLIKKEILSFSKMQQRIFGVYHNFVVDLEKRKGKLDKIRVKTSRWMLFNFLILGLCLTIIIYCLTSNFKKSFILGLGISIIIYYLVDRIRNIEK